MQLTKVFPVIQHARNKYEIMNSFTLKYYKMHIEECYLNFMANIDWETSRYEADSVANSI